MREARHLHLDRHRDVALDLLRRLAGVLGDDVDQRRHRVGIGLDVQVVVGEQAAHHQHRGQDDDQDALLESRGDESMHDGSPADGLKVSPASRRGR